MLRFALFFLKLCGKILVVKKLNIFILFLRHFFYMITLDDILLQQLKVFCIVR